MASSAVSKIEPIVAHIAKCLSRHRAKYSSEGTIPPLFVAFQGPQGSGKTYLTNQLRSALSTEPHNLNVAVLSIDDLYLTHEGLLDVACQNPDNPLLAGRGQPGTHDIALGTSLLTQLKHINENQNQSQANLQRHTDAGADGLEKHSASAIRFPVFDKSLFAGQGDRIPDASDPVSPPLDVLLFEGWCVGFAPIPAEDLTALYNSLRLSNSGSGLDPSSASASSPQLRDLKSVVDIPSRFPLKDILKVNASLYDYLAWWDFFDVFVQIKPPDATPYSPIYKWRLQQEHDMKAKNGGKGMSDEEVKLFIDRYIPGYVFFGEGVEKGYLDKGGERHLPRWIGSGLKVSIDEQRNPVAVDEF